MTSNLGTHAVADGGLVVLGIDPVAGWGRVDSFWAFEAVAEFITSRTGAALSMLPPIGCVRLDDEPGTAQRQLEGRDEPDRRQRRRFRRWKKRYLADGSVLNLAVPAEALEDGERVPLDRVWPGSVAVIGAGVDEGAFEPVCHGLLHLDTEALERSEIEDREFAHLDAREAGDRLDRAIAWQTEKLGAPRTFVAPSWIYGPAGDQAAAERGLIRWHGPPRPGPMLEGGRIWETLIDGLPGLSDLDYSPLVRLAAVGIPPVVVMHGALLDRRIPELSLPRDGILAARLARERDITRLSRLGGVRWIGGTEMARSLELHAGHELESGVVPDDAS